MIADEVQTLGAAQEDPNHLTFLIKHNQIIQFSLSWENGG